MPYLSTHVLIVFAGKLPGGEQWSCGFRTIAAAPANDQLQSMADYYAAMFQAAWSHAGSSMAAINPQQVTFETATVRSIGINGKTIAQAVGTPTAVVAGTVTAPFMPNQDAVVASLLTALAGRSFRGRVYWPVLCGGMVNTGRMDIAGVRHVVALFTQQIIEGINGGNSSGSGTVPPPPFQPRVGIQSTTSGQPAPPVIAVKVGDVFDTQRRRRNKIVENYETVTVPTPSG